MLLCRATKNQQMRRNQFCENSLLAFLFFLVYKLKHNNSRIIEKENSCTHFNYEIQIESGCLWCCVGRCSAHCSLSVDGRCHCFDKRWRTMTTVGGNRIRWRRQAGYWSTTHSHSTTEQIYNFLIFSLCKCANNNPNSFRLPSSRRRQKIIRDPILSLFQTMWFVVLVSLSHSLSRPSNTYCSSFDLFLHFIINAHCTTLHDAYLPNTRPHPLHWYTTNIFILLLLLLPCQPVLGMKAKTYEFLNRFMCSSLSERKCHYIFMWCLEDRGVFIWLWAEALYVFVIHLLCEWIVRIKR